MLSLWNYIQARLKLLAECYDKTMLLSSNLERAVRGFTVDVAAMSDGLFPTFLGGYPAQELQWLETAFQEEVRRTSPFSFYIGQDLAMTSNVMREAQELTLHGRDRVRCQSCTAVTAV